VIMIGVRVRERRAETPRRALGRCRGLREEMFSQNTRGVAFYRRLEICCPQCGGDDEGFQRCLGLQDAAGRICGGRVRACEARIPLWPRLSHDFSSISKTERRARDPGITMILIARCLRTVRGWHPRPVQADRLQFREPHHETEKTCLSSPDFMASALSNVAPRPAAKVPDASKTWPRPWRIRRRLRLGVR